MLIGLTGTLGAGKGAVVDYLATKKGFTHVSVSDFLATVARKRGIDLNRMTMEDVANDFRAKGPTALMEAVFEDSESREGNVIIESQHTPLEVHFIQEKGGIVIAVDADIRLRYDRICKRGSVKDNVSFQEFSEHQKRELSSHDPNKNNLGAAAKAADFRLTNNGTRKELHAHIDELFEKIEQR